MERQYRFDGLSVRVEVMEGLVRIVNDLPLKQALDKHLQATTASLVTQVKADYEGAFGRALAISDESFIAEIWGHLYADYLLLKYSKLLKCILRFGLYDRFMRSCEVIDCGEHGKDPNRWLWNQLAPFRKTLRRRLTNLQLSRFEGKRR